jgi:hypothetical protein
MFADFLRATSTLVKFCFDRLLEQVRKNTGTLSRNVAILLLFQAQASRSQAPLCRGCTAYVPQRFRRCTAGSVPGSVVVPQSYGRFRRKPARPGQGGAYLCS